MSLNARRLWRPQQDSFSLLRSEVSETTGVDDMTYNTQRSYHSRTGFQMMRSALADMRELARLPTSRLAFQVARDDRVMLSVQRGQLNCPHIFSLTSLGEWPLNRNSVNIEGL
jgi:hypothetical protein